MELKFEQAVELLEITDISKIKIEDLPQIEKKAKKRWHPDKVAQLQDPVLTQEYTVKFQQIETASQMIRAFLSGTYEAGEAFASSSKHYEHVEPEEIIRSNAANIQNTLKDLWSLIKEKKYKWGLKEVLLSEGYRLKDLLTVDFKEDLAILSVVSFFYGLLFLGIVSMIARAINPVLGSIVEIVWAVQALACVTGFAPLSRFWLPESVQEIVIKLINFGLIFYNWAEEKGQNTNNVWVMLLIRLPVLFARLIKYLIMWPLYEIAKLIVGEKLVGVVKQNVNYYADVAEWYIDELISKNSNEMTSDELFHLSYIYSELSDIKQHI